MRSVLVALGPWGWGILPLLIVLIWALLLFWQWAESRYGQARRLNALRALLLLPPAAVVAVILFLLVNRFAPVEIKSWGTMLVVGFAAGTGFLARYGNRKVIQPSEAVDLALFCLIGAVIGARLVFVLLDWGTYASHPAKLLNVWEGGLSFHGGLLGAIIAGLLFAHLRRKSFWALADETSPSIALGYAFARLGCFLNGCCHGTPCNLPWAMRFPHGEIRDVPVHPTQLYSMVASLIIFAILLRLRGRFPRAGHLFGAYLALYSVSRFLLEYTRAGATGKIISSLHLTIGQLASLIIFIVMVGLIAATWRCPHFEQPAEQPPKPKCKTRAKS